MASLLGKHQIAINTASLGDGDSLAAYLTDAAGSLLTSTLVGAKQRLDSMIASEVLDSSAYATGVDYLAGMGVVDNAGNWVPFTLNAAGELPVAATVNFAGDYPEDSPHTTGDIGIFNLAVRRDARAVGSDTNGDYSSFNVNAVGELWVKDADTLAELTDIGTVIDNIYTEQLDQGTTLDNIYTEQLDQGTTLDAILVDTGSIDATLTALSKAEDSIHASGDQGIQALAVRKDSQASNAADGDYTSLLTWSEGSLKVVDIANGTILQSQVSVTDTAAQVPAVNLANRKSLMLQNTSASRIWIGSATVTTTGATSGIELPSNSFMELEVGPAVNVYAVKNGAAGATLNLLQLA